ncbi:MAG: winged helix-turn-helix domain-containing protein [Acidobacteria bacterium]|nr:winged helix-turn-helix domain-containing protein [Acidobacteriota bacterium]
MAEEPVNKGEYSFGDFRVDVSRRLLFSGAGRIALTPKVFDTLLVFLERPNEVLEKETMMELLWADSFVEEANLAQNIAVLRKALGDSKAEHKYIITVPGRGYRFAGAVQYRPEPSDGSVATSTSLVGDLDKSEEQNLRRQNAEQRITTLPELVAPSKAPNHALDSSHGAGTVEKNLAAGLRSFIIMIACAMIILAAGYLGYRQLSGKVRQIDSIAVMPFLNESGNADLDYLSDGITDTLINSLARLPNLTVKAHSSVFRYKGMNVLPRTVASELSAQAILNGRVLKRGDEFTIAVELIDPQTENVLWSEKYDRRQTDLIALQTEIARDVAARLLSRLSGEDQARIAKPYTTSSQAYELYLRGKYHFYRRLPNDMAEAADYFSQAIASDSNFALAYSGLADTYALTGVPRDSMPKARRAATMAIALDSNLADAHNSLGLIAAIYDHDFVGAEREFKRALELDADNATSHFYLGNMYAHLGKYDEGLAEIRRAVELEPFSLLINRVYGEKLSAAGKDREALDQLNKTLDLDTNSAGTRFSFSEVYNAMGDQAKSVEEFAKGMELSGKTDIAAALKDSFARGGWRAFLQAVVDQKCDPILVPYYAQLGDKDRAFAELDRLFDEHAYYLVLLNEDRRLGSLRSDPRYAELVKRIGL